VDKEARLHGTTTAEHPQELRLWLRLLTCTQLIEHQVRDGLRKQFDTTLPRFDLMAQLERVPQGLKMNELSSRMMVTRGNITGITNQLVIEGLVARVDVAGDKRACRVKLTAKGRRQFNTLAREHEGWIVQAFAGLGEKDITTLHKLLGRVKAGIPERTARHDGGQGGAAQTSATTLRHSLSEKLGDTFSDKLGDAVSEPST
jgi:DNA-binding MarR family transcriptional regulator